MSREVTGEGGLEVREGNIRAQQEELARQLAHVRGLDVVRIQHWGKPLAPCLGHRTGQFSTVQHNMRQYSYE